MTITRGLAAVRPRPGKYAVTDRLARLNVWLWKRHRELKRGQTMTEYAMILGAIAVVVFVTYKIMGQSIENMVVWIQLQNDLLGS
jgi:Flp pilus assembly pilin Flp